MLRIYNVYVYQPRASGPSVPQAASYDGLITPETPPVLSAAQSSVGIPRKIATDAKFFFYFKDCIDALDGTHFPVHIF